MILRGHRTQAMADATLAELAAMAHKAEWENDDLTAIGLMEELEVRQQRGEMIDRFREHYQEQMRDEIRRRASQRR